MMRDHTSNLNSNQLRSKNLIRISSNMEFNSGMYITEGSFLGDKHKVKEFLGEGYYAYVFKCLNTETNKMEAVKVSKTKQIGSCVANKEMAIMELLQQLDPDECNIVRYYGAFSHEKHTCLRFELLDQTLFDYMKEKHKQGLPLPELRPIIQQEATALSHLSSVRIVHGDVKPENVMIVDRLQTPLRVKLIDFGLSRALNCADPDGFEQNMWLKPLGALGSIPYSEVVDMWFLGLTATELVTGVLPYPGHIDYEMLMREGHEHQRDTCLLVDLIKRTQQLDEDKRIKPKEVLQHRFFTRASLRPGSRMMAADYDASSVLLH